MIANYVDRIASYAYGCFISKKKQVYSKKIRFTHCFLLPILARGLFRIFFLQKESSEDLIHKRNKRHSGKCY